ncbi:DUF3224 domain-containing protein [Pseudoalteromonas sp. JBTF-M23]|uniref:DUF3224 domain-containing protein n=1 Tax=Pseudoalteromonas caenipelagi TaxID=2726988 RepID=A0A849VFW7_9GAMM|nr:DUF3224 domain-containing protein [Pseudoalteromonas caenipelagi]NOU51690.1 DUF3224 domain-containing protein [Pseudoalteromonas caenipelagi]
MTLTGTLQIQQWQEIPDTDFAQQTGLKTALVKQSYSGDIQGQSTLKYQLKYNDKGDAHFTGFEMLEGSINGTSYQLTLMHTGQFVAGVASSQFTVIASSPNDWLNAQGEFSSTEGGQAQYRLG